MDVTVHVTGTTNKLVTFENAKATTSSGAERKDGLYDLYIYRGNERIAHFVAGEWAYWSAA